MKKILFLRPHPFIADTFAEATQKLGFASLKFTDFGDFNRYSSDIRHAAGSVVSLAVASPVAQSAEEVIAELRRRAPTMPLVLAGLADIGGLMKTAQGILPAARFYTIDSPSNAILAPSTDVLIVRRDDFIQADRATRLDRLLMRHFTGGGAHRSAA
ncbi:MAG: hypothetical protein ACOVQ8_11095 [Elstera sp.]|jgi:hypothetical protein